MYALRELAGGEVGEGARENGLVGNGGHRLQRRGSQRRSTHRLSRQRWCSYNRFMIPARLCLPVVLLAAAAAQPAPEWKPMFDGKTLEGWKETPFTSHGKTGVENGAIVLGKGYITGVNWTRPLPTHNYEVRLEAARIDGYDFFAGITFPVYDSFCTWINGGWGGSVVGLSSLDGNDASENDTSFNKTFEKGRWYKLRLRVTDATIEAWIDEERVIYVELAGRDVGLRYGEIELSKPFGIAAYETVAGLRNIEYRELPAER
jgi:hypothetical protein